MMINRRHTKEDEQAARQQNRTTTVSLLSVVCLVAVLGSSAITGALAQQQQLHPKAAYDGSTDEDLQVNTQYTVNRKNMVFIFTSPLSFVSMNKSLSLSPYLFMDCCAIFHFSSGILFPRFLMARET